MLLGCPIVQYVHTFVHLSRKILLEQCLVNVLNSFDKSGREYSQAPTDNLIKFWRSKIKVTVGCQGQIVLTLYLVRYLSNLDETITTSLHSSPDCILEVKGQGHTLVQVCGGESIHVKAGASKSIFRSTLLSRPNKVDLKCPSLHMSVRPHKVFPISMKFGT